MSVAAEYAALFTIGGRRVAIERLTDAGTVRLEAVRARIKGSDPVEVSGGDISIERRILILAADVPESFRPLRQNDKILVDGLRLTCVARPDDQTHRDGETLLAYNCPTAGA